MLAAWWGWSRQMITRPGVEPKATEPFVQLADSGRADAARVLQERAEILDPTPMFLPTQRNAGQKGLPSRLVARPGQVFVDFGARLSVGEADLANYGADAVGAPDTLTEVLARSNEAPFAGLGETADTRIQLIRRQAYVDVKSLQGRVIISESISGSKRPAGDFLPLQFIATVASSGLVGDPQLVLSSGAEEVDVFFRDYLVKTARLGERLAPGVYRVSVGP